MTRARLGPTGVRMAPSRIRKHVQSSVEFNGVHFISSGPFQAHHVCYTANDEGISHPSVRRNPLTLVPRSPGEPAARCASTHAGAPCAALCSKRSGPFARSPRESCGRATASLYGAFHSLCGNPRMSSARKAWERTSVFQTNSPKNAARYQCDPARRAPPRVKVCSLQQHTSASSF